MTDTVTPFRHRERSNRNPDQAAIEQQLATINAALNDPNLIGWDAELRDARERLIAQLDALTADRAA